MVRLGKSVLEAVVIADHVEAHLMRKGGVAVTGLRLGELVPLWLPRADRRFGQDRMDLARSGLQQVLQEFPGGSPVRLADPLGDGERAGAVDGDERMELAFRRLRLGD